MIERLGHWLTHWQWLPEHREDLEERVEATEARLDGLEVRVDDLEHEQSHKRGRWGRRGNAGT